MFKTHKILRILISATICSTAIPAVQAQNEAADAAGALKAEFFTVKPDMNAAKALKFDYNSSDYMFSEGLCALKKNQLWGFIDTTGNWVIQPEYFQWGADVPRFSDGICLLAVRAADGIGNVPAYIDKTGTRLFKNQVFSAASPFGEGVAMVGKTTGPARAVVYSFINKQGVALAGTVIPKFRGWSFGFGPYSDGLARMWDDKLDSYGFVDTKGRWAIKPELKKWSDAGTFAGERCPVQNTTNFYWGYIDKTGTVKVPFDFRNKPADFSCQRAIVQNDRYQAGYIDPDGNMAIGYKFTTASFGFHNGFAAVTLDNPKLTKAIIDVNGTVVKELETNNELTVNSDGSILYTPKEQDGLRMLNPDGSVIFHEAMYSAIHAFSNNRAYVEFYNDGYQSGFINRKGALVIVRAE